MQRLHKEFSGTLFPDIISEDYGKTDKIKTVCLYGRPLRAQNLFFSFFSFCFFCRFNINSIFERFASFESRNRSGSNLDCSAGTRVFAGTGGTVAGFKRTKTD